ncbi:MAG: gamma-glutamyl-gamma-aminobutyrate hydrolase family protein [Candidatus Nanohalobium sp.]
MDVLVVDHYDSFTHNLVDDIATAGDYVNGKPDVEYHDQISVEEILEEGYDAIVLSPGPGHPANEEDIGETNEILREVSPEIPTLGVCLGMEAAVHAYGGEIGQAPEPVHGKAFEIDHDGEGVYEDLQNPLRGGRYHSLVAVELPEELVKTASTQQDGEEIVMGVRHEDYPIEGVQFHPESLLTGGSGEDGNQRYGPDMIANFLEKAQKHNQTE